MVESIDKERVMGIIKHEKSVVDFFYRCWNRNYCILFIFTGFIGKNHGYYCRNYNGMYWMV